MNLKVPKVPTYQSVNQSINFYSENIPGEAMLSDLTATLVFKVDETGPLLERAISYACVKRGKTRSKRCVMTCFLKAATEMA